MPARAVVEGIVEGTLKPDPPEGLEVALRTMVGSKTADLPLMDNIRAKRALKIPWRWFTKVPDVADERRADSRFIWPSI